MLNLVEVKVLPAMELYRFASAARPQTWYAASWWFGKSACDALLQAARSRKEALGAVARRCLAVPPEWSTMDVLISARVLQPLTAWSGTPRTLTPKDERGRYVERWEPDRAITQLYVPGLDPRKRTAASHEVDRPVAEPEWDAASAIAAIRVRQAL
jgi:hypothetical protein